MFFLFLCVIPFLASFKSCKMPSCCNHDKIAPNPIATTKDTVKKNIPTKEVVHNLPAIHELNDEKFFNNLIKKPTIVKFTASWCGACKVIQPIYEKLAQDHHPKYQFVIIDVDHFSALADKYHIRGLPTFLFFDKSEKLDGQIIGASIKYVDFLNKIETIFKS